ncbi:splicing factor 3B subunit 3-like [Micractinium conductrix]|uniref:Splicing factor 3B subunit 3-like n=1 Tax=Micractinium conductrix TaxID=554055 RepID=A0A2P6VMZ9_9CHLO|nr:splicing factor 3B subunit 3-like [Micractinium conductrix]|eukprot:PSC75463.1 splicing factor 3B subunit 3-like [Micractinium conductrix]
MHLLNLTLSRPSAITCAIVGSSSAPKVHEIVAARGQVLELLRPDESGRVQVVHSTQVFGLIRSLAPFRFPGSQQDYVICGSDSGRVVILQYSNDKNCFQKVHQETYGKSGCRLYQILSLGDDDTETAEASSVTLMETEEGYQPVFLEPRALTNLELVDRMDSLAPITDMKVANLSNEETPQIYAACGHGARSTLCVLRPGLAITEMAVSPLPGNPTAVWTIKRSAADEFDAYIVVSFSNATLVLSIGETVEEVSDSGFNGNVPTLQVQLLADDSMLQIYPGGLRHMRPDRRINEWRAPGRKSVAKAATNERQVAVALSGGEILYFELNPQGMLVESEKREMGGDVSCLGIAPVPEGRQRSRFLAVGMFDGTARLLGLDPDQTLKVLGTQAVGATPESVLLLDSPAAGKDGGDEGAGSGALFLQGPWQKRRGHEAGEQPDAGAGAAETMVEMSREMMKEGIIDEMLTDVMESAFGDDELEEETEDEVDKILLEVAGETLSQMAAAPLQQKQVHNAGVDREDHSLGMPDPTPTLRLPPTQQPEDALLEADGLRTISLVALDAANLAALGARGAAVAPDGSAMPELGAVATDEQVCNAILRGIRGDIARKEVLNKSTAQGEFRLTQKELGVRSNKLDVLAVAHRRFCCEAGLAASKAAVGVKSAKATHTRKSNEEARKLEMEAALCAIGLSGVHSHQLGSHKVQRRGVHQGKHGLDRYAEYHRQPVTTRKYIISGEGSEEAALAAVLLVLLLRSLHFALPVLP